MSIIKGTNQIVAGFGGTKRSIGEVYFSQSSLATDNSGALPLFTGEIIASANTIYPDFYNWVLAHTELQCTSEEYESALSTYGECPKYVIGGGSLRLPKLSNYIKAANTAEGITQKEAGLPNITGVVGLVAGNNQTGAFKGIQEGTRATGSAVNYFRSEMDASQSSPVYGKSDTVTPPSTTLYPWVVAYTAVIPAQVADFQQGLNSKVSKTGDTMTGRLTLNSNSQSNLIVKDNRIERGVAPASNIYTEMVEAFDKNDKRVASVEHAQVGGGGSRATLQAVKEINGENKYAQIHVGFDSSNNMYAACPTPGANSNSNNIATTQWVRNQSVAKAGDTMTGALVMKGSGIRFNMPDPTSLTYYFISPGRSDDHGLDIGVHIPGFGNGGLKIDYAGQCYLRNPTATSQLLRILTTADLEMIDYVVERQANADGSWYRKYKSGWLEQGGVTPALEIPLTPSSAVTTVTFLKPFSKIYSCHVSPSSYAASVVMDFGGPLSSTVSNTIWARSITNAAITVDKNVKAIWYAAGQGA